MGGGAIGYVVRLVIVGHVGGNDKNSGGNPYKLQNSDHREGGADKHRQYVGYTGGLRGVERIWNAYSIHIRRPQAGGGGALSGFKTDI